MASLTDVLVPDIGDFTDVPVVELLVAVGDVVAEEDPLVVVESDKATMEIPAPFAGTVQELKVAVGDAASEGHVIAVLDAAAASNGDAPAGGGDASAHEAVAAVPAPATEAASPASVASAMSSMRWRESSP